MPESPPPKDVADILENLARRIRTDPSYLAAQARSPDEHGLTVFAESNESTPSIGEVDLLEDVAAITVTAETKNADANSVHVTLAAQNLSIALGEGARASRRDLTLPHDVDEEHAVATLRNGVLDIVLPLKNKKR